MEIEYIGGNLLDSKAEIILHQVNCKGVMGSGVAKGIKNKWLSVYIRYKDYCREKKGVGMLGTILPVRVSETQRVMNLFGQDDFGGGGYRYTSYDAIDTCLKKVAKYCLNNNIRSVALPYGMSCGRGGGNWNIILEMIKEHFKDVDVNIEIWKL